MLPFRYCCISLSGNCEGRGDERRRGEGRGEGRREEERRGGGGGETRGGEERGGEGRRRKVGGEEGEGKGFVCFHMCELASFSGSFPVMISGEDLGNNASVNYPPLLPPA